MDEIKFILENGIYIKIPAKIGNSDNAMVVTNASIAISLKRIADALEKANDPNLAAMVRGARPFDPQEDMVQGVYGSFMGDDL